MDVLEILPPFGRLNDNCILDNNRTMKIAIIGAGNMGGAIARGLAKGSIIKEEDICVSNPSNGKLEALKADFPSMQVANNNVEATKDADIKDIKSVISHKQALGQCAEYINEHGFETIEEVNTAVAAKKVFELNDKTQGVICSIEAGEEYGLKLLDRKINKNSTNTTRFAVFSRVQRDVSPKSDTNFILLFTVKDEAGSLGKAISVFGESGYNLKTLKSRPSKDVIWNYYFFVEGEGKLTKEAEDELIKSLSGVCTNVRLVGKFTKEMRI